MLRILLVAAALAALGFQPASADHLVDDVYVLSGTVDFRIEDRWMNGNVVEESCEDVPFVGVLRITGPTTAQIEANTGLGSECTPRGWFHGMTLTGTPSTGYAYELDDPCFQRASGRIGPLGPTTTWHYEDALMQHHDDPNGPLASESSAMCQPDPGWCTCVFWVSDGVITLE